MKRCLVFFGILSVVLVPGLLQAQTAADADFDGNGTVEFPDFLLFAKAYNTTEEKYDLDKNGGVGFTDFLAFVKVFGQKSTSVLPQAIATDTIATEQQFEYIQPKTTDLSGKLTFRSETLKKDVEVEVTGKDGKPVSNLQVKATVLQGKLLVLIYDSTGTYPTTIVEGTPGIQSGLVLEGGAARKAVWLVYTALGMIKLGVVVYTAVEVAIAGNEVGEALREMADFHLDNFYDVSLKAVTYKASIKEITDLMNSTVKGGLGVISAGLSVSTVSKIPGLRTAKRKVYDWAAKEVGGSVAQMTAENIIKMLTATYGDQVQAKLGSDTEVYLIVNYWSVLMQPYGKAFEIVLPEGAGKQLDQFAGQTITATLLSAVTIDFVYIPPGTFLMGAPAGRHTVTIIKGFYLGRYEVTQEQWQAVMGTTPWKDWMEEKREGPEYPAWNVSWDETQTFAHKLNVAAGDSVYRLPTEAEWEYACRAGTITSWSFGDDESKLGEYAWYETNAYCVGESYPHKVGTKKPNPWGLYDMYGNVWEWVQDGYFPGSTYRVARGGAYHNAASSTYSTSLGGGASDYHNGAGFRLLRRAN